MALTKAELRKLKSVLDRHYRSTLERVRDELERSENQQYIELLGRVPADLGDQSVADALADLNLTLIDRHIRELREIEATRSRLRDPSFGLCVECGDNIGFERLQAYPTATRCVECQRRRETKYAHEHTPTL